MEKQHPDDIEAAYHNRAEDHLRDPVAADEPQARNRRHDLVQIAIAVKDDGAVVPGLAGPEPNPAGAANKRADKNQQNPHQKSPAEHVYRKPSLPERVIAVAERI